MPPSPTSSLAPLFVLPHQNIVKDVAVRDSVTFRAFLAPSGRPDWPSQIGAIDLSKHDLPHASSMTEWWYYNGHVKSNGSTCTHTHTQCVPFPPRSHKQCLPAPSAGREYSLFVCYFRAMKGRDAAGNKVFGYALNWGIADVATGNWLAGTRVDKDTPKVIKAINAKMPVYTDPRLQRALKEVLNKDNVPLPDRMFTRDPKCSATALDIDMEDATLTKDGKSYILRLALPGGETALNLRFTPNKPAVRHGLNGIVKGHDGDDMFYYFVPRNTVVGTITLNGQVNHVSGDGWYDHEFGGVFHEEMGVSSYAWNWAALQLDNGHELTAAVLVQSDTGELMETRVVVVDPSGRRTQPADLRFEAVAAGAWQSVKTFMTYPTAYDIQIPSMGIHLRLKATMAHQEVLTIISMPAYWEGRVEVEGTFGKSAVKGLGFVERHGFGTLPDLNSFFKAVGTKVQTAVRNTYPTPPTREDVS